MATHKKVCKICGKEFEPSHKLRAYCGDKCRRVAANRRRAENYAKRTNNKLKEKICKGCGETFATKNNFTMYCDECRKQRYIMPERNCKVCGKPLLSKQRSYCSRKCAERAYSDRVVESPKGTICWRCKWATGKDGHCPWASHLVPVEGWDAKKTYLKQQGEQYTDSYIVKDCPLFEEG